MKLNPNKCTFGVTSGKFLGYLVHNRRIDSNLTKLHAILEIKSPSNKKDVQSLVGRLAALSHFISRLTNKCTSLFKTLRVTNNFTWSNECKVAFEGLKKHLTHSPTLVKPLENDELELYLAVSKAVVSAVLLRSERDAQFLIYYISMNPVTQL